MDWVCAQLQSIEKAIRKIDATLIEKRVEAEPDIIFQMEMKKETLLREKDLLCFHQLVLR